MAKNSIRTSAEIASMASHTLAGRIDDAFAEMLAQQLLRGVEFDRLVDEIMKSLAGSALSNRRA